MKTKTFFLAIVVFTFFSNLFAFSGNVDKAKCEFQVSKIDGLVLGKSAEKVWDIKYSGSEKPVTVALRMLNNGKEYVVRTGYLELVYVADNHGFGLRKTDVLLKGLSSKAKSMALNKQQAMAQRIISPNQVSDEYALALIGSFMPDLLDEQSQHLIF